MKCASCGSEVALETEYSFRVLPQARTVLYEDTVAICDCTSYFVNRRGHSCPGFPDNWQVDPDETYGAPPLDEVYELLNEHREAIEALDDAISTEIEIEDLDP